MSSHFHLALPCRHIGRTKDFYVNQLGATIGRNAGNWIDINLGSHQITFTKSGKYKFESNTYSFGDTVLPSFHFGIILKKADWEAKLADLRSKEVDIHSELKFLEGKPGQHRSFFLKDPNGYMVEFKCFKNEDEIFEA